MACRYRRRPQARRVIDSGTGRCRLRSVVNEAALFAARRSEDRVHQKDFLDALEKLVLGPARTLVLSPDERERGVYREGGQTSCELQVPGRIWSIE